MSEKEHTWLVLLLGASRFGGAAVMNLGQA